MAKRIFWIVVLCCLVFVFQAGLDIVYGIWVRPNLILLFLIFINLHTGIRYGLLASFVCGWLFDSFQGDAFGLHILSYVICSFAIVSFRKYFLRSRLEQMSFRFVMAFCVTLLNFAVFSFFSSWFSLIRVQDSLLPVLGLEIVATVLFAPILLKFFKECALRSSV